MLALNNNNGHKILVIVTYKLKETHSFPFMQVREVNLSIRIHMFPCFYHHGTCGFDKADGRIVGIGVEKPQADRNVIHITYSK